MAEDPDLEPAEAIYDALDRGDPEAALELARRALGDADEDGPVLRFLCGRALMELDRPGEAASELLRAVATDPEDPELRAYAAWALFRACRFADADKTLITGPADARLAETHYVRGLIAERKGQLDAAERSFARAAELEPDWFDPPVRLARAAFERQLAAARSALPAPFREQLDRIDVIVDDLPSDELLSESDPPLDPEQLLGLFVGVPLGEEAAFSAGGELPPRIFLFKRNLERSVADVDDLCEQIRVTLYHELGHYLGMDEDDLDDLGYG